MPLVNSNSPGEWDPDGESYNKEYIILFDKQIDNKEINYGVFYDPRYGLNIIDNNLTNPHEDRYMNRFTHRLDLPQRYANRILLKSKYRYFHALFHILLGNLLGRLNILVSLLRNMLIIK